MSTGITNITSLAQLDKLLAGAGTKLTVIDFHATWCGPCHAIAPTFEALSKQYTGVQFLKCDVDTCQEVAQKYAVSAMPTFIFVKNRDKVDMVRGADPRSLESTLKKHAGTSSGSFTGAGQTLGGGETPAAAPAGGPGPAPTGVDPQIALLAGLLGMYLLYLYFQ